MKRIVSNVWIVALAGLLLGGVVVFYQFPKKGTAATGGDPHGHGGSEEKESAVTLSDAKVAAAGIELQKAAPGVLKESLRLNGIVQPNQEALVQVTPRFAGVVKDVRKRVGEKVNKGDLLAIVESNQSLTAYELKAPIAGTIIDRQAALGEYASEQKPAFIVADLSTVWVDFSVSRRDIKHVRVGDAIAIEADDGGAPIESKISYLAPVGSSETQSALARAVVDPELRLRPGFFVTGRLLLAEKPVAIAVKSSALQTLENRTVVFVRSGEKFEARDVEVGARDSELVEILYGLFEGDEYAAKNSFVIKAEIGKGSAGHEH